MGGDIMEWNYAGCFFVHGIVIRCVETYFLE